MKRVEFVGCSNMRERRAELVKAHKEFQTMIDNGFQLKDIKVRKRRPRIIKEAFKTIKVFGKPMKITIEEYNRIAVSLGLLSLSVNQLSL